MPRSVADDGVPIRSKRNKLPVYWLIGGGVALLALVMACGVAALLVIPMATWTRPAKVLPEMIRGEDTVGDLVEHFRKNGLKGDFTPHQGLFGGGMPGTVEAGSFWVRKVGGRPLENEITMEIYRFDSSDRAQSLEKSGGTEGKFTGKYYRSGKLVICIHDGEEKVLPIFKKF